MRSVDVDKIIDFCNEWEKHFDYRNIEKVPSFLVGIWTVKEFAESLPTLEIVKYGKWFVDDDFDSSTFGCCKCLECGEWHHDKYNYCPDCGAKMGEGKNNE